MTIRALVVDDSAFARKVVREILQEAGDIEVVGIARDGAEALEQIATLKPDVVTLDLLMPVLDGLAVLRAAKQLAVPPAFVVVSSSEAEGAIALSALDFGATDFVHKPTSLATAGLYDMKADLLRKVRAAVFANQPSHQTPSSPAPEGVPVPAVELEDFSADLVVLGTSTGGPQALSRLLEGLSAPLRVGMVMVVHIPPGYTATMAERLDRLGGMRVKEAAHGQWVEPGLALLAPGGQHLTLQREGAGWRCCLSLTPTALHRPSVDQLFSSAAAPGTLGMVLTGMGDDGLLGARAIRAAGGRVVTESAPSCVVYGMPRAVVEAGLSNAVLPLRDMAGFLMHALGATSR